MHGLRARTRTSTPAFATAGGDAPGRRHLDCTPPRWATRDLLPHLPNGHEVVLRDLGHSGDFWTYQPEASTRLVETFLGTGRIDTSSYRRHRVDFTLSVGYGAIAEIVLGVMLGLAALTVLSLVWLASGDAASGGRRAP
jgi:hypothetical protein